MKKPFKFRLEQVRNMIIFLLPFIIICLSNCGVQINEDHKIRVIFDTDANNELDDQHALAYLLLSGETFDLEGITVNATRMGGDIDDHYEEAKRIMQLCNLYGKIPLLKGAEKSFNEIRSAIHSEYFDGKEAVEFIIQQAKMPGKKPLILIPVGKLTNIALALEKAPEIDELMRVVWLGSNYPLPGEYNQNNDIPAMNYILQTSVPFEMVTVRYGKPSGTDAVKISHDEIKRKMPGLGPLAATEITGRHGIAFRTFGDYSLNLFENIKLHGDPPSRSLYDLCAFAIIKNPAWAETKKIPCPVYIDGNWADQPKNLRKIKIWEHFNRDAIVNDLFDVLRNYVPLASKI